LSKAFSAFVEVNPTTEIGIEKPLISHKSRFSAFVEISYFNENQLLADTIALSQVFPMHYVDGAMPSNRLPSPETQCAYGIRK
jgi:hypothetical protein